MCRNIRPLFNFEPPTTDAEIRAAAVQFVRKISGYGRPSAANRPAFDAAVDGVANVSRTLLRGLTTTAPPKNRAAEAERRRARANRRLAALGGQFGGR